MMIAETLAGDGAECVLAAASVLAALFQCSCGVGAGKAACEKFFWSVRATKHAFVIRKSTMMKRGDKSCSGYALFARCDGDLTSSKYF